MSTFAIAGGIDGEHLVMYFPFDGNFETAAGKKLTAIPQHAEFVEGIKGKAVRLKGKSAHLLLDKDFTLPKHFTISFLV